MKAVTCRTPGDREYVHSTELAERVSAWLARHERDGENHCTLARRAGVSPRTISKVLSGEREFQTVWLADRLVTAMGGHVAELEAVWRCVRPACKRTVSCPPAGAEKAVA